MVYQRVLAFLRGTTELVHIHTDAVTNNDVLSGVGDHCHRRIFLYTNNNNPSDKCPKATFGAFPARVVPALRAPGKAGMNYMSNYCRTNQ